jgi:hypothetical protein
MDQAQVSRNENQIQAFEDIHHVTSPTHNVGFSYHVFEGI